MSHKTNTPLTPHSTRNEENLQEEKLLKTGQVAKLLKVNRSTIQRWAENGVLFPVKTTENGYNYYSQKQLDIFRQEHPDLCKTAASDNQTAANLGIGVKSTSKVLQNLNPSAAPAKNDTPKSKKSTALVKIDTPIGGRVKKNDQRIVTDIVRDVKEVQRLFSYNKSFDYKFRIS